MYKRQVEERIHSVQDNISQQFGITKENIKSVGTFLFDSTLKKDLSPASLTLLLPSFLREQKGTLSVKMFSEKAVPVRKESIQNESPAIKDEHNLPVSYTHLGQMCRELEQKILF